ncbi:MAG: lipoyl(octanoyl) transferase LipB [Planctomycetota bacterium]|nr:MAG: lipoyl(octanoyl) transferase LipB [Planctomycetota bacterium]
MGRGSPGGPRRGAARRPQPGSARGRGRTAPASPRRGRGRLRGPSPRAPRPATFSRRRASRPRAWRVLGPLSARPRADAAGVPSRAAGPAPGTELRGVDLGRIPYAEAWELQQRLARVRAAGASPDLVLYCEHDEVVTVGRRAQSGGRDPEAETVAVRAAGIPVVRVERGGAATYHGPGQLVGYPIVGLGPAERDLHAFLRRLEGALVETIEELTPLSPGRAEGLTGVWVGARKVASIGIACRRWVTYHGFALNLDPDLSRFRLFRPCDLEANAMASLASLGAPVPRAVVLPVLHDALARRLGRRPAWGPLPSADP